MFTSSKSDVQFARCVCFLQSNIFLPKFGIHVSYLDENQFLKRYKEILSRIGCKDANDIKTVQEEVILPFIIWLFLRCVLAVFINFHAHFEIPFRLRKKYSDENSYLMQHLKEVFTLRKIIERSILNSTSSTRISCTLILVSSKITAEAKKICWIVFPAILFHTKKKFIPSLFSIVNSVRNSARNMPIFRAHLCQEENPIAWTIMEFY